MGTVPGGEAKFSEAVNQAFRISHISAVTSVAFVATMDQLL